MKMTVNEYATAYKVSPQSVYKRIQRGTIPTSKENGTVYVLVDDIEVEQSTQPVQSNDCAELLDIIRRRDKEVKILNKEIKRLTKELTKAQNGKNDVLEKFIFEMKQLQLQAPTSSSTFEEDVIDVKGKKGKKKKEKGKGKKKEKEKKCH